LAMGTVFELQIDSEDVKYAKSAAVEAFRLLDSLEQLLSRFIVNSDVSRINSLVVGQSTRISVTSFECLLQCVDMYLITHGVFDVTIGELYHVWLNDDMSLKQPSSMEIELARRHVGIQHLEFDDLDFSVTMRGGPVKIDLGGFGKGFAVDRMAELLIEWDIDSFVINGGQSSLRFGAPPHDQPGWLITLSDPFNGFQEFRRLHLAHTSISSSGIQKGAHIIDPRTGYPVREKRASWSLSPSASCAEGWSTAFMIMNLAEISQRCTANKDLKALILTADDSPLEKRLATHGEI